MNTIYLLLIAILMGVLQWILSLWIEARLKSSIEHEYSTKLEEYRFLIGKREKVARIADALAHWIKYRGQESQLLNKKELINYYEQLNKFSFELTLWIEDDVLLKEIMDLFCLKETALNVREVLIKIRKIINNIDSGTFEANDIIIWPNAERQISLKLFDHPLEEK